MQVKRLSFKILVRSMSNKEVSIKKLIKLSYTPTSCIKTATTYKLFCSHTIFLMQINVVILKSNIFLKRKLTKNDEIFDLKYFT